MSDFKTHLSAACAGSGLAATTVLLTGTGRPSELFLYFVIGIIGGILPDIDADQSVPIRLIFDFLAPVIAFPVVFSRSAGCSVAELFILWIAAFLTIRYFVRAVFTYFTVHRGSIHSIPAAILFGLATTILLNRVFIFSDATAWAGGCFVFFGFIIHLILDELNSLKVSKMRVKKSFGTALKLGTGNLRITILLYIAIVAMLSLTPDPRTFIATFSNKNYYLHIRFFPEGQWFESLSEKIGLSEREVRIEK